MKTEGEMVILETTDEDLIEQKRKNKRKSKQRSTNVFILYCILYWQMGRLARGLKKLSHELEFARVEIERETVDFASNF